jgi:hypothetical protein
MTRIITPGLFLVAVMFTSACTEAEDDLPAPPADDPDVAACCAVEDPPGNPEPITVDPGRRARVRLDFLRRANLRP